MNNQINPMAFAGMHFETIRTTGRFLKNQVGNGVRKSNEQIFKTIVEVIEDELNISYERIISNTRRREVAEARQILQYLAKKFTTYGIMSIGVKTNRHHSSVIHSEKVVKALNETDKDYSTRLGRMLDIIHNRVNTK